MTVDFHCFGFNREGLQRTTFQPQTCVSLLLLPPTLPKFAECCVIWKQRGDVKKTQKQQQKSSGNLGGSIILRDTPIFWTSSSLFENNNNNNNRMTPCLKPEMHLNTHHFGALHIRFRGFQSLSLHFLQVLCDVSHLKQNRYLAAAPRWLSVLGYGGRRGDHYGPLCWGKMKSCD